MKYILSVMLIIASLQSNTNIANATTSLCKASETSTAYCKYVGKIKRVYMNSDGLVLAFLDKNISPDMAEKFGYSINSGSAVAFEVTKENSHVSSLMYQTIVQALNEGQEVEIHARSVLKGYMKLDRIWLNKNSLLF